MMRRREFIAGFGGAAAWPLVARGQQTDRVRRIGVLFTLEKDDPFARQQAQALLQGLQEAGRNVGTDLQVDFRFAGGNDRAQIQAIAKDLVATQPDVIQVLTTPGTAAVLMETQTIPVVFSIVSDPVGSGFVETFSHPGRKCNGLRQHRIVNGRQVGTDSERSRAARIARYAAVQSCYRAAGELLSRTD
jgi:putative tryptophan/tyrosine transport system substrate-binding protein